MRTFKFLLITLLSFGFFFATAQTKTGSVTVLGNCGMCQGRIENAAKAAGATSAKWDVNTDLLTVTYSTTASSLSAIEAKVASAGHDTQNKTASKEAYGKLHGCCQYDRKEASTSAASYGKTDASCCAPGAARCAQATKASNASKTDCCADNSSCCKNGQDCCAKPAVASAQASVKDCCVTGAVCCQPVQGCCGNDTPVTASTTDCCSPGASCCASGANCCTKTAGATTVPAKECCTRGADCCIGGACCSKPVISA